MSKYYPLKKFICAYFTCFRPQRCRNIRITTITTLVIGIEPEDLREIFHVNVFAGRSPVEPHHSERLSFHGRCIFMQRVSYLG